MSRRGGERPRGLAVDSPVVMAGTPPQVPGCRDLALIGERVARSIFSAYSDALGRPVSVTVYPPLSGGRTAAGFEQAAATAQRLGAHPSVLTVHDWGIDPEGRPWVVTDPQPAESVDMLLTLDGPLPVERAMQVGILLAGALETAHRAGIVHGDLSPARLVFGQNGEPLLAETGLADYAVFPGLGALNNPVRYHAPPEVLERTGIGPATDVYSLATTVYALVAGRAPHQKPAEVTDSNASLLLRILQMPVPRIERPDLPPGFEDALRAALAPEPEMRPQRAIELAWALQDVQRRAGMAVTEPVVLDLAGGDGARQPVEVGARPTTGEGAEHDGDTAARAGAAPAPAAPPRDRDRPPAPERPSPDPLRSMTPWAAATAAGAAGGAAAGDRTAGRDEARAAGTPEVADPFDESQLPPPTIFPFREGLDEDDEPGGAEAAAATGAASDAGPGASPWAPDAGADGAGTLWPSSWPTTPADDSPPPWAASRPPADVVDGAGPGGLPDEPRAGAGGDATTAAPRDDGGSPSLPPELLELPAWYTAPLPNPGGGDGSGVPGPNGHGGGGAATTAWDASTGADRPADDGHPAGADPLDPFARAATDGARPGGTDPLARPGGGVSPPDPLDPFARPVDAGRPATDPLDPLPRRAATDRGGTAPVDPLAPGAGGPNGHDPGAARSVPSWGDEGSTPSAGAGRAVPEAPADGGRLPGAGDELRSLFGAVAGEAGEPRPAAPPGRTSPLDGDVDPLGPPEPRPPIDMRRLEAPLGPPPPLPRRADPEATAEAPARLPRRHEVDDGGATRRPATPRLPRAGEAPADGGSGDARSSRPRGEIRAVRVERDRTRTSSSTGGTARRSAGPPALPLVVLIGVVVVLLIAAIWLVVTGADEPPASDDGGGEASGETRGADDGPAAPTGIALTRTPEGMQVSWTGDERAAYVVTVLSPDQPPKSLPRTEGTSVLVGNVELGDGARCFTVAAADADGGVGPPSDPVCPPGVDPEAVRTS